jgi:hypothetical protein
LTGKFVFVTFVMLFTGGVIIDSYANYSATQGSGTTFGSIVIGGVHYAAGLVCDATTGGQCAAVGSSGQVSVANSTGAPITGQSLPAGGVDMIGWLSNVVATLSAGQVTLGQATMANSVPVTMASNQTQFPVSPQVNVTATDCSSTITSGGTAQNAFAAQTTLHGFVIKNIDASAGSGEPLWISFTGTAVASTAASYPLAAPTASTFLNGESFTTPNGFGTNHAVSIIAATTGHKFSCTWW